MNIDKYIKTQKRRLAKLRKACNAAELAANKAEKKYDDAVERSAAAEREATIKVECAKDVGGSEARRLLGLDS